MARLTMPEIVGIIEPYEHEYPESQEVLWRVQMALYEAAIAADLKSAEYFERLATLGERRSQALSEQIHPGQTDDEYPSK